MKIKQLEWDSNFFGLPTGSINVNPRTFSLNEFKKAASSFRLVYLFSSTPLSSQELTPVGTKVTFTKQPEYFQIDVNIREPEQTDFRALVKLGLESGRLSRFASDVRFSNEQFEDLYTEWVRKSLNGEMAYKVLTMVENGHPEGMVTLAPKIQGESVIGLFAVSAQFRSKGIGKALIKAAETESYNRADQALAVVTQGANKKACEFYSACGFSRSSIIYTYHYWNDAPSLQ